MSAWMPDLLPFRQRSATENATIASSAPAPSPANQAYRPHRDSVLSQDGNLSRQNTDEREWKFTNIWQFLRRPDDGTDLYLLPQFASLADLRPGQVIYIRDKDTRLNNRVMVVLFQKRAFFECVAMCNHYRGFSQLEDHWRVRSLTAVC